MANPIIRIHNSTTNEVVEREMTDAEYNQYKIDGEAAETRADEKITKAAVREALLTKLGITSDEAKLLLG